MLISAFLFITALVILALIDLRIKLLPDFITLPLLLSGLALSLAGITITIGDSLVGMALGYSILLGTHFLYKMLTNRDGVGFGDIKLMAAIGAWTGWHHTIDVIFIASITAALTGCFFLLIKKTNKNDYLAFGPHLIAATIFMLLAKDFYQ
ncbi:MAG: A24 family peptidase [Sheuella sp.]|nr:A24 family peptidase [Sheuella sp.]